MIDVAERKILRNELARLVSGESTNVEFEDVCHAHHWHVSRDRGIAAIGEFGGDLCDFEHVLLPFRLIGKFEVSEEARQVAERCNLFLQSSQAYEWPVRPSQEAEGCLAGMAIFLGFPFAIALGLIALMMAMQRDWGSAVPAGAFAAIVGSFSATAIWWWSKCAHREDSEFERAGNYNVWPFLRRVDYSAAIKMVVGESVLGSN